MERVVAGLILVGTLSLVDSVLCSFEYGTEVVGRLFVERLELIAQSSVAVLGMLGCFLEIS